MRSNLIIFLYHLLTIHALTYLPALPKNYTESLLVNTTSGRVYGKYAPPSLNEKPTTAQQGTPPTRLWHRRFLGIPFAVPPVGPLRFKNPVAYSGGLSEKILDGSQFGSPCLQLLKPLAGKEDCLHVNVFVPHEARMDSGKPLPVIFWIFGGGYYFGDGSFWGFYDPSFWLASKDVIFVTFNHRVSIFGFFNGSAGYEDVKLALKWTRTNIGAFGGDPDNINVMGVSSGSSIIAHLLVDTTAPLFKRSWMISPPLVLVPKSKEEGAKQAKSLAESNGCADERNVMLCMRRRSAHLLLASTAFTTAGMMLNSYNQSTVADGMFWSPIGLPRPLDVIQNPSPAVQERLKSMEIVTGNTKDEIAIFTDSFSTGGKFPELPFYLFQNQSMAKYIWDALTTTNSTKRAQELYTQTVYNIFGTNRTQVAMILDRYPPKNSKNENLLQITKALSSYSFECANRKFATSFLKYGSSARLYEFRYFGNYLMPVYGENAKMYNTTLVSHASDLAYYFHGSVPLKGDDLKMSLFMIDRVSSFTYNQDLLIAADLPSQLSQGLPGWNGWPVLEEGKTGWMVINDNMTVGMVEDLHKEDCEFWDSLGYYF